MYLYSAFMCKPGMLFRIARALIIHGGKVPYFIGGENET